MLTVYCISHFLLILSTQEDGHMTYHLWAFLTNRIALRDEFAYKNCFFFTLLLAPGARLPVLGPFLAASVADAPSVSHAGQSSTVCMYRL